jgi:hypothetical protein
MDRFVSGSFIKLKCDGILGQTRVAADIVHILDATASGVIQCLYRGTI